MSEKLSRIVNIKDNLLFRADKRICGENQIPAELFAELTDDLQGARDLAKARITCCIGSGTKVIGTGLNTFGLSTTASPLIFALGSVLTISGAMVKIHTKNVAGSSWDMALRERIDQLGPHQITTKAALIDAGFAQEEIESLHSLPAGVYNAELKAAHIQQLESSLSPICSGIAMAGYHDFWAATAVAGLGLLSFPLGQHFYKESDLVRAAKFRIGKSTRLIEFLKRTYKEHVAMTDKTNFITHTSEILFAIKYLLGRGGNALPALYGFQQGLQGLSSVLATQRDRELTKRTTEIATHFIKTFVLRPFITTAKRWIEHLKESEELESPNISILNGLVIRNFVAQSPSGEKTVLAPISLDVSLNSALIIKADSGTGKSVTLMGIMHLLEHSGSIYLVKDGKLTNVHSLQGPDGIAEEIVLITEEGIRGNDRVVDLFKESFLNSNRQLYLQLKEKYDPLLVDLAWKAADNLLEQEIEKIEKSEECVFPREMKQTLIDIRDVRNAWVLSHLKKQGGNIAESRIHPERVFSTLSAGEKKRMLVTVAEASVQTRRRTAIILDEPLAHLDDRNRELQLKALQRIQEGDSPVALLIVSHQNIDELQSGLNNCKVVELESVQSPTTD